MAFQQGINKPWATDLTDHEGVKYSTHQPEFRHYPQRNNCLISNQDMKQGQMYWLHIVFNITPFLNCNCLLWLWCDICQEIKYAMYLCFAFNCSVKDTQDAMDVSKHLKTYPWTCLEMYQEIFINMSWDILTLIPLSFSEIVLFVLRHVLRPIIIWSQDGLLTNNQKVLNTYQDVLRPKVRQSQDYPETVLRCLETVLRWS
jgi:hypothetical protein